IECHAVRLERILDPFTVGILPLQAQHVLEPWNAEQCRLASLPRKADGLMRLRFYILANVSFEHVPAHRPVLRAGIELFLLEIKAIRAVEITQRTGRFRHYLKRAGSTWKLSQNGHLLRRFLCCCCR